MIRNLLVGLFIAGGTCVAAPASPTSYANNSPQQTHLASELAQLQNQLALTPVQTATVKAAMESIVHGEATKTVGQVLHEICTPAQFSTFRGMELASMQAETAQMAAMEADELGKEIVLGADQRSRAETVFYQIDLADTIASFDFHSKAELDSHRTDAALARENALEKILTPAQLEKRGQIAQARVTQPLPNLPSFSLVVNIVPDRYGWSSDSRAP